MTDDFYWDYSEEPHRSRREQILKKYPHIKKLYGYDPNTKYKVGFVVLFQYLMALFMEDYSWMEVCFFTYTISGLCNHFLTLALHECSHSLLFRSIWWNKVFSIFTNLPLGIPAALSFRRYHQDHHKFQGDEKKDVDVPTAWEGKHFHGMFRKIVYLFTTSFFYGVRPYMVNYKSPSQWEWINIVVQLLFDMLVYYCLGIKSLFYFVGGTVLGMGLHPCAGHFISEHYIVENGQETYSYYGPLNMVSLNVGYHVEHHDFPTIPGSRLPLVRQIAKEFYQDLRYHTSWINVLYQFIVDPRMTPYRRVKRTTSRT